MSFRLSEFSPVSGRLMLRRIAWYEKRSQKVISQVSGRFAAMRMLQMNPACFMGEDTASLHARFRSLSAAMA
jgi:hypothetical protein